MNPTLVPRSLSGWGTGLDEPKLCTRGNINLFPLAHPSPFPKMSSLVILISAFLVGLPGCGDGLQRVCASVAVHEAPHPPSVSGDDLVDLCKQHSSFIVPSTLLCLSTPVQLSNSAASQRILAILALVMGKLSIGGTLNLTSYSQITQLLETLDNHSSSLQ